MPSPPPLSSPSIPSSSPPGLATPAAVVAVLVRAQIAREEDLEEVVDALLSELVGDVGHIDDVLPVRVMLYVALADIQ
jgi:hypothetical protein